MEEKKIKLPFKIKKSVLALGSQGKNTVCFAKGNFAYLSAIHQNLSDLSDFKSFEKDVKYFLKKRPNIIAYDLHPEYQSTKYALSLSTVYCLLSTQHHHAHIASCMAENGMNNQKVIGVAFDGTGLGEDGTLWGAEFLVCDYKSFKRAAHLREIALLGGEMAIFEPWRLAALWLYFAYGDKFLKLNIDFVRKLDKKKWAVLKKMYLSGINSPLASSAGRLFDAAASLVLSKYKALFEAELAIELEKIAESWKPGVGSYEFKILKDNSGYIIDPKPMFKQMIMDLKSKQVKAKISYKFHYTVSEIIKDTCAIIRQDSGINKIVLSGGVFQNKLLTRLCSSALLKSGFNVFKHELLSCNDSSISLGQAAIVNYK